MSLRNHFYIKLYVNDIVSDEKLNECSAEANGVYFRLIFFLHRQKEYGCFTIVQEKELSTKGFISVFSNRMLKHMPFTIEEIERGITELHSHDVIQIESNRLSQKRMVKDNDISEKRSGAGKLGGPALQKKIKENAGFSVPDNSATDVTFDKELANEKYKFYKGEHGWLEAIAMQTKIDMPILIKKLKEFCIEKNNGGLLVQMDDGYFKSSFNKFLKAIPELKDKTTVVKSSIKLG